MPRGGKRPVFPRTHVVFRTKPQLAAELVLGPGQAIRHGWVSFDEGYGKDPVFPEPTGGGWGIRRSEKCPRACGRGCSGPSSRSQVRGLKAGRGTSRVCEPINRPRKRWSRWRRRCRGRG